MDRGEAFKRGDPETMGVDATGAEGGRREAIGSAVGRSIGGMGSDASKPSTSGALRAGAASEEPAALGDAGTVPWTLGVNIATETTTAPSAVPARIAPLKPTPKATFVAPSAPPITALAPDVGVASVVTSTLALKRASPAAAS